MFKWSDVTERKMGGILVRMKSGNYEMDFVCDFLHLIMWKQKVAVVSGI